jgi:nucleoside-diphosphate-sugar epimerase
MSVRSSLAGRHLLITGATGFVGKVLLERILSTLPDTRVTLLVRPAAGRNGVARMGHLFANHPVFTGLSPEHGKRVQVWQGDLGDLTDPPPAVLDADLVLHLASRVDFEPTPADAWADNIHGTEQVIRLASETRGGRLLYTSTCYVAGLGRRTVEEAPAPLAVDPEAESARLNALATAVDPREGRRLLAERASTLRYANGYTLTKALAEHRVLASDLHTTIVRPAIVEAAWDTPLRGYHEGFRTCAPLVGLAARGLFCIPAHPQQVLDLVPVDRVARGLLLAAADALSDAPSGQVWQLASSHSNPLTMDRLTELVELCARVHGDALGFSSRWLGVRPVGHRLRAPGRMSAALKQIAPLLGGWSKPAGSLARDLGRIQRAADLFTPFLLDSDHRFVARRAEHATAALPADEQDLFGFDVPALDWRAWWTEAQFPGLQQYCLQAPPPLGDAPPWPLALPATRRSLREVG